MKICFILGTRPEIVKLSPVIKECNKQRIDFFIIHSNQHYSDSMDAIFFRELGLEPPKYNLNVRSKLHGEMTGKIIIGVESVLLKEKPDCVLVEGDTNTVMAGALATVKLQIKVGHVEAGLRSYDRNMPEEINRVITDHISDLLFCPTKNQAKILKGEGIDKSKIFITGNTIVDVINQNIELVNKHRELEHYKQENYFLLTLHRPANVDNKDILRELINSISEVSKKYDFPVCFPIHPRTKKQIDAFNIKLDPKVFEIMEPVGYLKMLFLEMNAKLIFTDSGGVQEEACILQVPSVTLRDNTERRETVEAGSNILVGHNKDRILTATDNLMKIDRNWINPFGDGFSSEKIVSIIKSVLV